MKNIKKYWRIGLFCLFSSIFCITANAQDRNEILAQSSKKFSLLESVKMSTDGKYITSRLTYDHNRDTLLVFNTAISKKPLGFRIKIMEHYFIGHNVVLLPTNGSAELWDLKRNQSIFYKDIVAARNIKGTDFFVIHYGPKQSNKLTLCDQEGKVLQRVDNVKSFFVLTNGQVAAVTIASQVEPSQLFVITATEKRKVYSSDLVIENVEMGYGNSELFIFERNITNRYQNLKYLDFSIGEVHALKDILPLDFHAAYLEKTNDEKGYFMRLWTEGKVDSSLVDIWYGSDRDLLKKYYSRGCETAYLWQPREGKILDLSRKDLPNMVSLGNGRYFLGINPSLLNDYTVFNPDIEINFLDVTTGDWKTLGRFPPEIYVSGNVEYLLSPIKGNWFLYSLRANKGIWIGNEKLTKPFFTDDGSTVFFEGDGGLWQYGITSGKLSKMIDAPGYTAKIINGNVQNLSFGISKNAVSLQDPLLVQFSDPDKMKMRLVKWHKGKETSMADESANLYTETSYDNQIKQLCYVEQNYNLPPRLIYSVDGKKKKVLFQTNKHDKKVALLRQETITYTDGQGLSSKGLLFYPADYNESETYPMVVHIYEKQGIVKNQYLNLSFHNTEGFNARVLLENGYFVFFPDIQYGRQGPGIAALQCVTNALDALKLKKQIDQKKIGLTGHSFGGYEVNFIATQSDRFATYLSGTGSSDVISGYHSFNLNYLMPLFSRYETFQFRMYKPFSEDKQIYYNNNPIYNAEKVTAPILLWTGMLDENIKWEETRSFYNALLRNKKPVIALFYRNEGHSLQNMDANLDLSIRTLDWFNYFLKDDHSIIWIEQEIKKGAIRR